MQDPPVRHKLCNNVKPRHNKLRRLRLIIMFLLLMAEIVRVCLLMAVILTALIMAVIRRLLILIRLLIDRLLKLMRAVHKILSMISPRLMLSLRQLLVRRVRNLRLHRAVTAKKVVQVRVRLLAVNKVQHSGKRVSILRQDKNNIMPVKPSPRISVMVKLPAVLQSNKHVSRKLVSRVVIIMIVLSIVITVHRKLCLVQISLVVILLQVNRHKILNSNVVILQNKDKFVRVVPRVM